MDKTPPIDLNDLPQNSKNKKALKKQMRNQQERERTVGLQDKKCEKRKMDHKNSQRKKSKIELQARTQSSDDSDQDLSADDILSFHQEDNSSPLTLSEKSDYSESFEESISESIKLLDIPRSQQDGTLIINKLNSAEDVNMFSFEELRVELTLARKRNKELTLELAQKTEEAKRLQQLALTKQSSQMTHIPPRNKEHSPNKGPRWKIFENVLENGKSCLLDGLGHKMLWREKNGRKWHCSKKKCSGSVIQTGDSFSVVYDHTCEPQPNLEFECQLILKAKQIAQENKFDPSLKLVRPLFKDPANCLFIDDPSTAMLSIVSIAKVVDQTRKKLRPSNPENLFFELEQGHIPEGFLRADVVAVHSEKSRRHLMFCTERQTELLKSAKCWFLDRTCKIIDKPFVEIVSIHGAYPVLSQRDLKQIPLLYVLMSSRKAKDYSIVFEKILEMLGHNHCVEDIVFNFDDRVLKALEKIFPTVSLYGCPFQWTQTVLEKFKALGLIPLYDKFEDVQKLCSRVLALHLLPGKEISNVFHSLKAKASELKLSKEKSGLLMEFFEYVENNWINNSVWTPERWSVFMQPVMRINVDAWHRKFTHANRQRVSKLNTETFIDFYTFVYVLYTNLNATWPKGELRVVSLKEQANILRQQSMTFLAFSLFKYWDSYNDGDLTAFHLVKMCAPVFIEKYSRLRFVDL